MSCEKLTKTVGSAVNVLMYVKHVDGTVCKPNNVSKITLNASVKNGRDITIFTATDLIVASSVFDPTRFNKSWPAAKTTGYNFWNLYRLTKVGLYILAYTFWDNSEDPISNVESFEVLSTPAAVS